MTSDKVRKSIQIALEQLHEERERIDGAIGKLESFLSNMVSTTTRSMKQRGRGKGVSGTGRVAKKQTAQQVTFSERSRAGWTDEARDAARARMRKYWAERRKQSAGGRKGGKTPAPRKSQGVEKPNEGRANRRSTGWTPEAREAARNRMREYWNRRKSDKASG